MDTNHNRIKVSDLEINEANKILTTNDNGELEFSDISDIKIDSYNSLDYIIPGKALDARQGKVLKDLIDNANQLLASDNVDLNTLQKLGDAIEVVNTSLNTISHDINEVKTSSYNALDCIIPGKILDARQGKILKDLIDDANELLVSDNIDLNTLQKLGDAIEVVRNSLSNILVNDLTTGGSAKALTAEMGKNLQNNKVDKIAGKSLISDSEISRLSTLSNYTHPANHPASIITQDSSNRFVTDAEKASWNAKQSSLGYSAENSINKNAANGYAGLGADGKLISSQLPSITVNDTFVIASHAEMLALTVQTGDVAVRTDLNKSFILKGTNPAVLSDWQELLTPTSDVTTVFGRNGAIISQAGDYSADQITETSGRKFQSANQQAFNDATSSIQNQLNSKASVDGSNVYGNWPINISGNSNSSAYSSLLSRNNDTGNLITSFRNTTAGNKSWHDGNSEIDAPIGGQWFNVESMRHSNASNVYGTQQAYLWGGGNPDMYLRQVNNDSFGAWARVLNSTNYSSYSSFSDVVSSGNGFQTSAFAVNTRNRIWSFGNADGFGLSYFQGTSGLYSTDSIGIHFGDPTNNGSQFIFASNGDLLTGGLTTSNALGVNQTNGGGQGISLYSGAVNGMPSYGLMFATTSNFGGHGSVGGDWATYFTMAGANNRGWIFRSESNNVASISATGVFTGSNFVGSLSGNASTATIANQMNWTNYGAGHIIFDASSSLSPSGRSINNLNSEIPWTTTFPTLMGWNGSNTYGVRVDTSRISDRSLRANGNFYIDDNYGNGVVGVYSSTRYQGVFAMGDAYKLSDDGTATNNCYGLAWTHSNVGGQSIAGLEHQLLVLNAGVTKTSIGNGIWTSGAVTGSRFAAGYDAGVANSFSCDGWFRSGGSSGWFNGSYGGGIWMQNTTNVEIYGNKQLLVNNNITATGDVIAYYSDERLKTRKGNITNAIDKVKTLNGFYYKNNGLAKSFGYKSEDLQVGLSAQEVQAILPEVVTMAPFDREIAEDGTEVSKTGEDYLTVNYAKIVPLLVEAIKEQQIQIEYLLTQINQ